MTNPIIRCLAITILFCVGGPVRAEAPQTKDAEIAPKPVPAEAVSRPTDTDARRKTRPVQIVEVKPELERLMSRHGFETRGIEQTADAKARIEDDNLLARLHALLENFDHVIVTAPGNRVERVIILGEKAAYVPPPMVVEGNADANAQSDSTGQETGEVVLQTQRKGSAHLVALTLEGPDKQRVQQSLLIDTGADQVVLPASLIGPLGLAADSLRSQQVQTANGMVDARIGTLAAIWLGKQRIPDVNAAFIEDSRLGGQGLLGMNVLGRFQMTIEVENSRLTLTKK